MDSRDTLCYVKDMRGWYIEIYKDDKFLYTSIIVVFLNDNSEYDRGKEKKINIDIIYYIIWQSFFFLT